MMKSSLLINLRSGVKLLSKDSPNIYHLGKTLGLLESKVCASALANIQKRKMATEPVNMEAFCGKYKQVHSENYDEFLKDLGVNWFLRQAAQISNQNMEISVKEGNWEIKTSTLVKTMYQHFRVGEEYDETTLDGRDVRTLVQFKDEKIHIDEKPRNEKSVGAHILHELETPDIMVQSMWKTGSNLKGVFKFQRV